MKKRKIEDWGEFFIGFSVFAVYAVVFHWTESNASWENLFGYDSLPSPWHSVGFALLMFGLFAFLFAFILFMGKRKLLKEKLEKDRFKEMFVHIPLGIVMVDEETGSVVDANPKALDLMGKNKESLIGKSLENLFPSVNFDDPSRRHEIAGKKILIRTDSFKAKIGSVSVSVMVMEDVTSVHEGESENRKLAHAIRQTDDAVFMTTVNGKISYVNPSYERLTGKKSEEVLGKDYRLLKPPSVSDAEFDEYGKRLLKGEELRIPFDMLGQDGSLRHVISVTTPVRNEMGEIEAFVTTDRDVTEERRAAERFRELAETDELTGMTKRSKFVGLLNSCIGGQGTLYFCDLDGFKEVNDVLGHGIGDKLLVKVAKKLAILSGGKSRVCRLGGDEFLLLPTSEESMRQFGAKLLDTFLHPVPVDEYELSVSVSVGAVPLTAANDPETLLQMADMSMYKAKKMGKNRMSVYSEELLGQMSRRMMLEQELKIAVKSGALTLVYQPQFNLMSMSLSGVEALLRWNHPLHGVISPLEFIPVAERSKLIVDLGLWSFRMACRQMRTWLDEGIAPPVLSVNLSVMHIVQENVPEALLAILDEENIPADRVCLEMTESLMLSPKESTLRTLEDIKLLGMSLALDDFGTGYSSLSYLKEFPIDKLKIDKNFIQGISDGIHDAAIVSSVIQMSKGMGLRVIAEGVETREQLDFLVSVHCDEIQGYFGGRPMSAEDYAKWMESGKDQLSLS